VISWPFFSQSQFLSVAVLSDDLGERGWGEQQWNDETQKFVVNCSMYLELVKYLVWICLDTE